MDTILFETPGYRATLTDVAREADRHFVRDEIRSFNNRMSPPHLASRAAGAVAPLDILVRDDGGQIIGGLTADTYWDWLEINYFWLAEGLRKQGLGTRLLLAAEVEARRRGCRHVHLTTFGFQARGFYEKLGYRLVGQLDDYPPGGVYYWLRKDFGDGATT